MNQHVTTPPYLHDRWDDQVALEEEMLATGKIRMMKKMERATEQGNMTGFRPYRSLIKEWVLPVAEEVQRWIETQEKPRRGTWASTTSLRRP